MPTGRDSRFDAVTSSSNPSLEESSDTRGASPSPTATSSSHFQLASLTAPVASFKSAKDKSRISTRNSTRTSSNNSTRTRTRRSSGLSSFFGFLRNKVFVRGVSKGYVKTAVRKIPRESSSFFMGGVLSWQTSRGVHRLRLSSSGQRFMFGGLCSVIVVLAFVASILFYQHRLLAIDLRRLSDSAALLRQAHSVLVDGSDNIFSEDYSGLNPDASDKSLGLNSSMSLENTSEAFSSLSLSRKMLSLLSPRTSSSGNSDSSENISADIELLRDRALTERDLRRALKSLRASQHRNGTLSLERADLQKKYERLERDLAAHSKDLKFQRVALGDASRRTSAAEDRLSHIETSAFSLLRDLRDVLGADEIVSSSQDPMLAIRDLAETFAHKSNDRRERLLAYSEYLDYAISGLERTVFSVGIDPSFLEGLGYDISSIASLGSGSSSSSSSSSSSPSSLSPSGSDLLSIGIGGPLSDSDSQTSSPQASYKQTFSELDSRFERFNSLRRLVSCMPLGHPLRGGGRLVSGYGRRLDPFTKEPAVHYGIDFGSWYDTDVYPGGKGRVTYTGYQSSYGRIVEVSHGCGFQTRYAHLSTISVKIGDEVDFDSILGKVGNTGRSTGPHLHYEVRLRNSPFDPQPFLGGVRNVF